MARDERSGATDACKRDDDEKHGVETEREREREENREKERERGEQGEREREREGSCLYVHTEQQATFPWRGNPWRVAYEPSNNTSRISTG